MPKGLEGAWRALPAGFLLPRPVVADRDQGSGRTTSPGMHLGAFALLAAAVALAYGNALGTGFFFDAKALVRDNPVVRTASADAVRFVFTSDYWQPMATDGLYRPLTMLSFLIDWSVLGHGDQPYWYVVENVCLHAICAALLYVLVWTIARRWAPALAAALLFAVHPVTTEAVTNVVGRADLLATAGVLAALVCWPRSSGARGARRALWIVALALSTALALGSKESGLVLVVALPLFDLALARPRTLRAEHAVVGVVVSVYLVARWWVARTGLPAEDIAPIDNPIVEAGFLAGRLTALGVLARLVWLAVWPATLSIDYSYRAIPIVALPPRGSDDWIAFVGLGGLVVAIWMLARVRRREPRVFFLGALALVALLPTSNLLRVIGSIMAERFLYLPLAALAGCVALAVDGWARGSRRRAVATGLLVIALLGAVARTRARNLDWQDEERLWAQTIEAVPHSAKAHKAYGAVIFNRDDDRSELPRAIVEGERAVAIRPDYQQGLVDLASYYITHGDVLAATNQDAQPWFERAIGLLEKARALDERATTRFNEKMLARGAAADTIPDVGDGALYTNLALAQIRLARYEDALRTYERLRALTPMNVAIYRDISALQVALGKHDDAAASLIEAMAIGGGDAETRERTLDFYRTFPHDGPSLVIQAADGEHVDPTSPLVKRHQCRAWHELAAIFGKARLTAAAERARYEAAACTGG